MTHVEEPRAILLITTVIGSPWSYSLIETSSLLRTCSDAILRDLYWVSRFASVPRRNVCLKSVNFSGSVDLEKRCVYCMCGGVSKGTGVRLSLAAVWKICVRAAPEGAALGVCGSSSRATRST